MPMQSGELEAASSPFRTSRTPCPAWSRRHSGTAEPEGSGRERRCWAGSPAAGRSCDGSDCTYTRGGGGGCRGGLAQVSAHTHTHTIRELVNTRQMQIFNSK